MMIGIMSDTHGDIKRTVAAIAALKTHHPEHIIHCGDIGSDAVLTELAAGFMEPAIPVTCVLGNVDSCGDDLMSSWPHVQIAGCLAHLTLNGKKITVIHGDDFRRLEFLITSQACDYIFTGHTHERADERHGKIRIINPGALHRSREPGCAVLDLTAEKLTYLSV